MPDLFLDSVAVIIAIASTVITFLVYKTSQKKLSQYKIELEKIHEQVEINRDLLKNHAHDAIHKTISEINYQFLSNDLDFPILKDIDLPVGKEALAKKNTVLLMHQINLYYLTYLYRDAVGEDAVSSMRNWMIETVKPTFRGFYPVSKH